MDLKKKIMELGTKVYNTLAQDQEHHNPEKTVTPGMPALLRSVTAQGAVLLENRVLPFAAGTRLSLFGRVQWDWFFTGYGSGGDVNAPYRISLLEALRECDSLEVNEELAQTYERWIVENPADHGVWGHWPRFHPEMPLTEDMVSAARESSDQAVVVLGRASGEDRENTLEAGSYYLTEEETAMLRLVTQQFPDAVLILNIGTLMDLGFLEEFHFGAVLIVWQGGMESGNAAADLLCGKAVPSGRLTDTIPRRYEDHPSANFFGNRKANTYWEDIYVGYRYFETFAKDAVRYPFGWGLSYTTFRMDTEAAGPLEFRATVTNTGKYPGKNAVLLFVEKPCGILGNPARELVAFGKTKELAPGESQTLALSVNEYQLCSYDDAGLTGHKSCYVLQSGDYVFYLGENVRDAVEVGGVHVEELTVYRQLTEAAAPQKPFPILARRGVERTERTAATRTLDLKTKILSDIPKDVFITGDKGHRLKDVKDGKIPLDTFVGQLSTEELEAISRGGCIMGHPLGPRGNAGIFGGVTESLRKKGVPPIVTTDGPSGIRLYDSCSLLPIGTLLAFYHLHHNTFFFCQSQNLTNRPFLFPFYHPDFIDGSVCF